MVAALFERDVAVVTWWGTRVECASAIARQERESALDRVAERTLHARVAAATREGFQLPLG